MPILVRYLARIVLPPTFPAVACLIAAGVGLLLAGCDSRRPAAAPLPPPVVTVSPPLEKEFADYIEYTGTTVAIEQVDVRARVKGFLQSVNFAPRAKVRKDQLLFVIDPSEYQAKHDAAVASLAGNTARYQMAQYTADRTAELYKTNSAAEYERNNDAAKRDEAKAMMDSAKADLAEAKLNLDYTSVKAPIAGRVSRNLVDVGNLVGAGEYTLLTTIVNDDALYVYFNLSEGDLLALERTREQRLGTTTRPEKLDAPAFLALADETTFPHEGRLDFADTHIDPSTGTITVRAIFPNDKQDLLPGLFARVRIPISKPRPALMVSERALGIDQGQRFVLLVNEKNIVEYRRISVGSLEQGLRVVTQGLQPNDLVITAGLQRVRPGVEVNPRRAPMDSAGEATTQPAGGPQKAPSPAPGIRT